MSCNKLKEMKLIFFLFSLPILFSCSSKVELKNGDFQTELKGLKITYSVRGKGLAMIVSHPTSGKIGYELTLKPLEEKFTMIYYNPRGTANSEAPKSIKYYQSQYLVEELEEFRKKLNLEKIWLLGHSDQTAIDLQYALKYPKKVEGMILMGTSYVGTIEESIERRKINELSRIRESDWFFQVISDWDYMIQNNSILDESGRDLSDAKLKWWCYNEETFQKVKPIVAEINKAGRRKPINNLFYVENEDERKKYLNIQKDFFRINTKTLIINGKYDTNNSPEVVLKLHQNLRNSKLVIIDSAGHFPWVEQPFQTFKEINNWLIN